MWPALSLRRRLSARLLRIASISLPLSCPFGIEAMKAKPRRFEARVASVSGSMVDISAGANEGVEAGDAFEIFRGVREAKDR